MNKRPAGGVTRRSVVAGLASVGYGFGAGAGYAQRSPAVLIDDRQPGNPISRFIYGSNEIGTMDGGAPSGDLDRLAGVTARRLGGNLMTTYNWVNNASNAGKDYQNSNGAFLLEALGIPKEDWNRPGIVVETMHETSLSLGAVSLVTVPIAGYVAADFSGPVAPKETAPSSRFVPIRWSGGTDSNVNRNAVDITQFIARLIARYGDAGSDRGIWGYALDNEPGLWSENHPRIVKTHPTIQSLIERSITAATAIKAIDPKAMVFGPASWGATEMVNFQNAPDFARYRHYGSFLAAYLDAFREASERAGHRLIDVLDVHWYAFSRHGVLYRSNDPQLAPYLLDAPRSLTEASFREESWVSNALPSGPGEGIRLPLLPSLTKLTERWFPGTDLAVTEYNYGGADLLASGLAVADALGRFGSHGVRFASHWGSLTGWLAQAYRLYREPDASNEAFGQLGLPVENPAPGLSVYAARSPQSDRLQIIALNKTAKNIAIDVVFRSARKYRLAELIGFDAARSQTVLLDEKADDTEGAVVLTMPPFAARRYVFAAL